jgi:23S rRNA U2552 (ribose-2'-O)-methylase RlmE/FtsJ
VNANIYGADIDKNILKDEERIKTFYVDQTNPDTISALFKQIGQDKFDVILEDGLHEFNANICFFENAIDYLDDNGVYIIEDIYYKDKIKFINYFKNLKYNFSIIDLYHQKNIANNCVIVVRKNNEEK